MRLADGSLPLLTPMSEVAGRMAPLMGAHHLMSPGGGRGVLVCGVPGVRCAKVVILGAGVAGMAAATLAVGMHSEVYILDRNLERLRQVDHHFRGALETVASSTHAIEETCIDADIVIGAVLVVGAKAPKLVSDELVARMRDGLGAGGHLRGPGRVLRVDPARPPTPTPPSRSTARCSTAWPTCPEPFPTRPPTRWSMPPCPTCSRSPTTGGGRPCGPMPPWPRA